MNKLHKSIILLIIYQLIQMCPQSSLGQSCQVEGYIEGVNNKSIIFGYQYKGVEYNDTIFARKNHFNYKVKPSDDGQITLTIIRGRYASFWCEPGIIKVVGVIGKPHQLSFTGTSENNILTRYNQTVSWPYERKRQGKYDSLRKEEQQATLRFIQRYPTSRTSADLLYWQTFYNEELIDLYEKIFDNLAVSVKSSDQGKRIVTRIQTLRNQPIIGKPAPLFSLPDTAGNLLDLADFKGKYVLLDFWGHWCGPCIKSFPRLRQLQQTYAQRIVILGIAAEHADDKEVWQQTIKINNLTWQHVSELKSDKGEITQAYNVTAYPTYFLLDVQGIVIAKSNDLNAIEARIKSIFR